MKGKGKGDRNETKDIKVDSPSIPDIQITDHSKQCPRYTMVLSRPKDDSISIEEVDILQTELEALISSVARRMKLFSSSQADQSHSDTKQGKEVKGKDIKGKGSGKGKRDDTSKDDPGTPSKRSASGKDKEETPSKKSKVTSSGKGTPTRGPKGKVQPPVTPVKAESPPVPETPETPVSEVPLPLPPVPLKPPDPPVRTPKNDAPNRFWNLVEPYCAEIATDDLKVLEDIMRSHEDDADYYKIPPIGKHYADKWAHEDMLEEQRQGRKLLEKSRSGSSSPSSAASIMKKVKDNENADSPFGPLTQRLVQSLIEENIMTPLDETGISDADAAEAATISPRSLAKQLNIGNTTAIERRIKRELEENGILDPDDKPSDDDPNDEILNELKKKQSELKAISQHNMTVTKRLYKMAKEEMARQDLQKKMIVADAEVMDAYRKIQATRAKKKTPSKKELDAAKRALKDREAVIRQMETY